MTQKTKGILILFIIIGSALIVRLPKLFTLIPQSGIFDYKILWYDEALSITIADRILLDTVQLAGLDSTPCLFFVLLNLWLKIVGAENSAMVAVLPLIFSLASVAAVFFVVKKIVNEKAGYISAFLLAFSPLNIQYSTEIRAYSLLVLLTIFLMYFFYNSVREANIKNLAGVAVLSALLLYTHYIAIALVVPVYATIIFLHKQKLKRILISLLCLFVLYVPALLIFKRWTDFLLPNGGSFYDRFFTHGDIVVFLQYLYVIFFGPFGMYSPLVLLSLAAIYFFWKTWGKNEDIFLKILVIVIFSSWVVLSVLKLVFHERYYVFLTVPLIIYLSAYLSRLNSGKIICSAVIISLFFALPNYFTASAQTPKYFGKQFASIVSKFPNEFPIIAGHHAEMVLKYYLASDRIKLFFPHRGSLARGISERWRFSDYPVINNDNVVLIDELIGNNKYFWVAGYEVEPMQDPSGALFGYLDKKYVLLSNYIFPESRSDYINHMQLRLYSIK